MRMSPQSAPDVRMAMAEGEEILGLGELGGRHEEAPDAPLPSRVQSPLALVRPQVLEVAVGVDGTGQIRRKIRRAHLTLVPLGTGAAGCSSTGEPSTEAARTMPLDSTPMSLAGWRFATTTTCLPTRSSGL